VRKGAEERKLTPREGQQITEKMEKGKRGERLRHNKNQKKSRHGLWSGRNQRSGNKGKQTNVERWGERIPLRRKPMENLRPHEKRGIAATG